MSDVPSYRSRFNSGSTPPGVQSDLFEQNSEVPMLPTGAPLAARLDGGHIEEGVHEKALADTDAAKIYN